LGDDGKETISDMANSQKEKWTRGYSAGLRPILATPEPDPAMIALLQSSVLFQDDHVMVINKPADLAVHPGPRTPESLELYLEDLAFERKAPPQPAHRLDRDTSGCLVMGRTRGALKLLNEQFANSNVTKTYWAVVVGAPKEDSGEIDALLEKTSSPTGGWRMEVSQEGKPALTRWKVLHRADALTWLELSPQTGRTHQIRIHCAHIGLPLLGDPIYGTAVAGGRTMLHARALDIPRVDGSVLHVEAPLPVDWPQVFAL
jgi:tRNA pseudouridine32 synthase / 23S rRNA pseudouridine746 synthase